MPFFNDLPIRGKIISALLVVIAFEILIALVGLSSMNTTHQELNKVVDLDTEKILQAERVKISLLEIHRSQKNLILSLSQKDADLYATRLSRDKNDLEEALGRLSALANPEELRLIKQFKTDYDAFLGVNNQIVSLVLSGWEPASQQPHEGLSATGEPTVSLNREAVELSRGRARVTYDKASQSMSEIINKADLGLDRSKEASDHNIATATLLMAVLSAAGISLGLFVGLWFARSISSNVQAMVSVADAIAGGDLQTRVEVQSHDETGKLAHSIQEMQSALRAAAEQATARDWLKTGIARINDAMRGSVTTPELCRQVTSEIATYLSARIGALYLAEDDADDGLLFKLTGSYAYTTPVEAFAGRFKPGEGLVGQAALEGKQIAVERVPEGYIKVASGLGEACPNCIVLAPFRYDGAVKGVLELGFFESVTELQAEYLERVLPAVAVNLETVQSREQLAEALARAQALTEELQMQQEELRVANEELEDQAQRLEQSQEELRAQQEELEAANGELEEKNKILEEQKRVVEAANRELERTRLEIEKKAEELAIASKYKSEFLANMSHELRTPLNSMLLLARLLAENTSGNLTEEQVQSAEIIFNSGEDLLSLINEILDLSKVEAGRMDLHLEPVSLLEVAESIRAGFKPLADSKGLAFEIALSADCPREVSTDRKRLDQILRNLVSNAMKFTEKGRVSVDFSRAQESAALDESGLSPERAFRITIADTGIGIPANKQQIVFEAFQQGDSGTARKYGGTGLGLSICRELVKLLGGAIALESREGEGSIFRVTLPLAAPGDRDRCSTPFAAFGPDEKTAPRTDAASRIGSRAPAAVEALPDDRDILQARDKTVLIIEDDRNFAIPLMALCREKGFKCVTAATGEEGLEIARNVLPKGIILDIRLPGMDGWSVLEALKEAPALRHIPVHVMSVEEESIESFRRGAIGHLKKPIGKEDIEAALHKIEDTFSRQVKELLIVEDDENLRRSISRLIGNGDVHSDEAATGMQALEAIRSKRYDCIILDLGLPDISGFELLRALSADEHTAMPPVIVYTGRELTRREEIELRDYSEAVILKGARSEERLLDEASLFLHRVVTRLPEEKRKIITDLHNSDLVFRDKQILIVDDDMRNVFALSRVLEGKGMETFKAENGQKALETLEEHPDIHLVLMDIMMPVMDGYEAMRRIRSQERFRRLPILALTAKAMKRDKEECLAAGASDYLAKPVDIRRLLSMMRVWMY